MYSELVTYRRVSLRLSCFLVAAFLFAGCRSNTPEPAAPQPAASEAPAPPPATDAAVPDGRPVIIAFGDSLTAGYGADTGDSYPDYLEKDLNAKGYHYQVVNQGISGNTTKDGVDRLQDALRLKPALVIVAFGGNDGLRGLPIASTRENLDHIVSTLLDHVPLLPFLLQNVYGVAGGMQGDGIHATAQGNAQVAKNLLPLIVPQLKK
jgi:acyl-CoA thioesterase-1